MSMRFDEINIGCIIGYRSSNRPEDDYTKLLVTNLWYNNDLECHEFVGYRLYSDSPEGVASNEFCIKNAYLKEYNSSEDIYVNISYKDNCTENDDIKIISLGYVDYNILIKLFDFIKDYHNKMAKLLEKDRKKIEYTYFPKIGEIYDLPCDYNDIFIVTKVNNHALCVTGYTYNPIFDIFEMITLPLSLFQADDIKDRVIVTIDNAEKLNLLVDNTVPVSFRLNGYPSVLSDNAICVINKSIENKYN